MQSQNNRTGSTLSTAAGAVPVSSHANSSTTQIAREALDALYQVSQLLNTGLDRETLVQCISLCEAGVNPEALAAVIRELRRETQAINQS